MEQARSQRSKSRVRTADVTGERAIGRRVRERAEAKIADIARKLKSLRHMKGALSELVSACARRGRTKECPILDSLEANGWFKHHDGGDNA